jgi:hypothetical protein
MDKRQDLDGPLPAIDAHPVAGAQARGGAPTADHGWNPQFSGDDGRMR